MNIFPEESLHSFLLRTLLRNGLMTRSTDLNGLITHSGNWTQFPRLKQHQRSVFFNFPAQTLLSYIENNTYFSICKQHTDPRAIPALYNKIFLGKGDIDTIYIDPYIFFLEQKGVRYCPLCFFHQLQNHGMTWFKLIWMYESGYCREHGIKLINIESQTCLCERNVHKNLLSVMSGKCSVCGFPSWEDVQPEIEKQNLHKIINNQDLKHTAPCVFWRLSSLLEAHNINVDRKIFKESRALNRFSLVIFNTMWSDPSHPILPPNLPANCLHELVWMVNRYMPDLYQSFHRLHTETLWINIRQPWANDILAPYVVLKTRVCKFCDVEKNRCLLRPC